MEPQQLFRVIRRRWRLIVVFAVVGAGLGIASASVGEDAGPLPVPVTRYEACHVLLVDTAIPVNVEQWDVRNLAQLAERLTQGEIPSEVARSTGTTSSDVVPRLRVLVRNDIQSLEICTVGESPGAAEELADDFAAQLLVFLDGEAAEFQDERLVNARSRSDDAEDCKSAVELEIAALVEADPGAETLALDQQLAECRLQLTSSNSDLIRFQSGGVPVVPLETLQQANASQISESTYDARLRAGAAGNNVIVGIGDLLGSNGAGGTGGAGSVIPTGPVPRGLVGAAGGVGLALALIMFSERLDSRLRRKEEIEELLDLPVLAEIPRLNRRERAETRISSADQPRSRTAESFRALRSAIDYARMVAVERGTLTDGAQVVLITSAGAGEGKTTTVANLAAVMAEGDRRVLAVNCDFRRPRLHRYLGGSAEAHQVNETDLADVHMVTQVTNADAESSPSEVVAAQRRLVKRARDRFDVILLDTAPVMTTNDAAELLPVADHVVLVVAAGQTTAESAARASEILERRGALPLGVAIIGARDMPNSSDYYYDDEDPYLERADTDTSRRRRSERHASETPVDELDPAPAR
jgi:Mrp family chromosome partitioning ATPase